MDWAYREYPAGTIVATGEDVRGFVRSRLQSFIFSPKHSLDDFEKKLNNTFDLQRIDLKSLQKNDRIAFAASHMNHCPHADFKNGLFLLLHNEKSACFYRHSVYQNGVYNEELVSLLPILLVRDEKNDQFWSNDGLFGGFLIVYQGVDDYPEEEASIAKDADSDLEKLYMYYNAVHGFDLELYEYFRQSGESDFCVPNAYR